MARANSGVGRGNGPGSRRTWFKAGMPSANAAGRPRKPKREPDASLRDAALKALLEDIFVNVNGVRRKEPRVTAMIKSLLADFGKAELREKLAILKYLGTLVPETNASSAHDRRLNREGLSKLVERLAEEHERSQELEREFGGRSAYR